MKLKEVKPINFLYFKTTTTLSELGKFIGIIARELYRDAILNDLEIAGPVYWHYFDFNGDPMQPFTLEINLPVTEIPAHFNGKFKIKQSACFHCVTLVHDGSWLDMGNVYQQLMGFASQHKLMPTGNNRELYIHMDFAQPDANVTEIQLGVTAESYQRLTVLKGGESANESINESLQSIVK